ncbi:MAG: S26 family signal peptidase [Prevotella sp.]|nr:S26 family signal peptidase [Prevotella sp.]
MIDKEKAKLNPKWQWTKCIVIIALFLLFLYWVKSWWGLIVVPFIFDAYITKKIRWQWWKDAEGPVRFVMSWVDAIVFALVAVYFINLFFFQNYVIPSSSLEKSLLTGDYLFVSKVSYGPRIPQTPLTMPLTQHTMPLFNCKSYIAWPQWDYRRVKGLGHVELNDIVVFNYPAGDTILTNEHYQTRYYREVYEAGVKLLYQENPTINLQELNLNQQRAFFEKAYEVGRDNAIAHQAEYGVIDWRPTDRRENYVKRCVGLPGQTLQIKDRIIYLDGKANKEPEEVQYNYLVKLNNVTAFELLGDSYAELRKELGISKEDIGTLALLHGYNIEAGTILNEEILQQFDGYMPLTKKAVEELKKQGIVRNIRVVTDKDIYTGPVYPFNSIAGWSEWTRDNYGPIWIPKKGGSLALTLDNLPVYERCIRVYEGNELEVKNGKIFINGKQTSQYTFKLDYYWMQGDNRHNSEDSRYWGFVPEDHVVGKPLFIWWSSDPDRRGLGGIRWNRLFRWVDNIK